MAVGTAHLLEGSFSAGRRIGSGRGGIWEEQHGGVDGGRDGVASRDGVSEVESHRDDRWGWRGGLER